MDCHLRDFFFAQIRKTTPFQKKNKYKQNKNKASTVTLQSMKKDNKNDDNTIKQKPTEAQQPQQDKTQHKSNKNIEESVSLTEKELSLKDDTINPPSNIKVKTAIDRQWCEGWLRGFCNHLGLKDTSQIDGFVMYLDSEQPIDPAPFIDTLLEIKIQKVAFVCVCVCVCMLICFSQKPNLNFFFFGLILCEYK